VAHRLSTVVGFDRVIVVEQGRIVEDGAPLALLRSGGAFQRLWALQAEGLDAPVERRELPRFVAGTALRMFGLGARPSLRVIERQAAS
jgi:ATP-binding cassette subfamily B protein